MTILSGWQDTIVAQATAPGGAIGLIRLSGEKSIAIVDKLFPSKSLAAQASHTLHVGLLKYQNHTIDEVVISIFKNPYSYTGEEVVEISCHGSAYIQQQIIDSCIRLGARSARPGEFTQRAFINGKLDLAQAEAVADLIAAENNATHEIALNQLRGGVSSELAILRDRLVDFTALIELELDFAEEDVAFANRSELNKLIRNLQSSIKDLIVGFEYGNAIKNGVPVVIIGKPNAGKSTLLNALLNEERAIVSDIAGTTRDVIEEAITIDGISFRFIDTAGIRKTEDAIETVGVERAKEKIRQAKVVIHLYEQDHSLLNELENGLGEKIVFNLLSKADKKDQVNNQDELSLKEKYPNYHHFSISVKTRYNLDLLIQELLNQFKNENTNNAVLITNIRHKEALVKTMDALVEVENGMQAGLSGDLLSLHLKEALYHLGTITGKIDIDKDILGSIFTKFCIGK